MMIQANRNVASFNIIIEILQNDQSKIKLIRKYENTRKKIINNECAILFNKTCVGELPKYIYIGVWSQVFRNGVKYLYLNTLQKYSNTVIKYMVRNVFNTVYKYSKCI